MWQWATLTTIKKNLMFIYITTLTLHLSWVCWRNLIFQLCPISTVLTFPASSFTADLLPVSHPQALLSQLLALHSPLFHTCSKSGREPRQVAHPSLPTSFIIKHSLWCSGSKILPLSHWPYCIFQDCVPCISNCRIQGGLGCLCHILTSPITQPLSGHLNQRVWQVSDSA